MIISDPDQILYGDRIYKFKKDVIVLEMALYSLNTKIMINLLISE